MENFKKALSFLESFGFCYEIEKNKKECYTNKYGKIVLEYVKTDPNEFYPQIYLDINGWKTVINVEKKYSEIKKSFFRSFFYKLNYVIKNEIKSTHSIYSLKIENQFISEINKIL